MHRLDALDAFSQKLVKKIAVRGITVRGLAGSSAYLYLDSIEVRKGQNPTARVELEVQTKKAIKRQVRRVGKGARLHDLSNGIEAYKDLYVVDVDAINDRVVLSNGDELYAGQLTGRDITDDTKRRIQIREVIRAHLEKERDLHRQGIKVLSLLFIDEVVKYRDYDRADTLGEYARVFEEEYRQLVTESLDGEDADQLTEELRSYLRRDEVSAVHEGYFSIDKKTQHMVDGATHKTGDEKGQSKDVSAFDLILKDKERLLSLEEPVRFIFSHSALREGWDNPNVFVMGMLKKSDNTISRRQEIGRGLRLAVNQDGERQDHPATVHDINELTVVTDESYTDFVTGLQREIAESLSARPRKATVDYFIGKTYQVGDDDRRINRDVAKALHHFLIRADYIDEDDVLTDEYRTARDDKSLAEPKSEVLIPVMDSLWPIVDALDVQLPVPPDDRRPKRLPLNKNFEKDEFKRLWKRINHRAIYQVDFDSDELIARCVDALDDQLTVTKLQYVVLAGVQREDADADAVRDGKSFKVGKSRTITEESARSQVRYDLLGEITEKTQLTRRTAAAILRGIAPATFALYRQNPEQFITETSRLINECKATVIVEHITYDRLDDRFETAIFTESQTRQDLRGAGEKLNKHIYDYVVTDSQVERSFVADLDTSHEVAVYAKLPRGFFIPTPVGDYNPDWAIAFTENSVKHVYFVAETKGTLSSMEIKGVEKAKIDCAKRFFATLSTRDDVRYGVVDDYAKLMQLVTA